MKKILVPIDFSACALQALETAQTWAEKYKAELILLNIVEKIDEIQKSTDDLKELSQKMNVKSYPIVHTGNIKDAIAKVLKDEKVDMIVMGTRGNNQSKKLLLGSTAENVLRETNVPVLSIKYSSKKIDTKKIALAVDLDEKKNLPIEKIQEVLQKFEAELHILYVNTTNNFSTTRDLNKKMNNFAEKYKLSNYKFHIFCDVLQDEGIKNFANDEKIDLVIMMSHQRKGLSRFWQGSVSEGVVGDSVTPVFTFPIID
ncbi:MAG: universal stress protein [Bacteroidetes bacterium]|nr:MAG: universal stress protein [Bacteroidota bacterium]TAG85804.1 MAG: universal stress protein [Bacteroidota bacterium]